MLHPLSTGYNFQLVGLSILIAMLASYTALDLAGRVTATQGRTQAFWCSGGAVAMGIGIWSMHFIGMLAFRLPVAVTYDFGGVIFSILPATTASGLALFLVSRPLLGWFKLTGGGLLMGSGIATMHYLGMDAMQMTAMMVYSAQLVILSVLIAIVVSCVGLFLVFRLRSEEGVQQTGKKLLAAIVMGAAIPTMHYTGMAAAQFIPVADTLLTNELRPPENVIPLATAVIVGTLLILGLALLTTFFDRRLSAQFIYSQALQESQKYLKTILQGIQVGVFVISEDDQVQVSNPAVLQLLHLRETSELQSLWNKGRTMGVELDPSLLSPEDYIDSVLHTLRPIFQQMQARQSVKNTVVHVAASSGTPQTALLINAVPLSEVNTTSPQVTQKDQVICTLSDVTELKQIEQQLQESEGQFRRIAQQEELLNHLSTQIRGSLDLQTILQTAVQEVRQLFHSDRALIYQFNADWHGQVTLEDVQAPWSSVLGQVADDCFPDECLERYRNGHVRAVNDVAIEDLDPKHRQFLQRSQVRANLTVPIVVLNQLWGLLIVHQCGQPRIWQESEGLLLNRFAIQLGIAIQQANLYAQAQQSTQQAQAQAEHLRASEIQLREQAQSLQKALQELQTMQLQLAQSEKMSSLGQLVAGIAHEINNPVNFIHGNLSHVEEYAENLLKLVQLYEHYYPTPVPKIQAQAEEIDLAFLQKDLTKLLASMKMGTDRIRQIVLSLRNFSRMDEADFKAVDIHEGIDSTLLILQHRLKAQKDRPGIKVVKNYASLPLIECYAGQLNQVFMNILSNSIDALEEKQAQQTPQDQIANPCQIEISTKSVANEWLQVSIADNGLGMPESVRRKIFEPFFTTKPVGKGTGMGLSISYQIVVKKHGGQLECYSSSLGGTEFLIQLPLHQLKRLT